MRNGEGRIGHRKAISTAALIVAVASTLGACSAFDSDRPDGDLVFLAENWSIDIPASAETTSYYTTKSDFQGGRDDVYEVSMEAADRVGYWDHSQFTESATSSLEPSPQTIIAASEAPIDQSVLDRLRCRKPEQQGQDYLLLCFDDDAERYLVFEQIL